METTIIHQRRFELHTCYSPATALLCTECKREKDSRPEWVKRAEANALAPKELAR